jgi:caffeoyl-CoA O-methyltransferase
MDFISPQLLQYCEQHSAAENDLLNELNRATHLKTNKPRMLSGRLQGRFLSFLSKLIQPQNILEIGTYTGYSALCLAEGLAENGQLITIDSNSETNKFAQKYFEKSPFAQQINLIEGNALNIIPTLNHIWDIVFIDADKENYSLYFDSVIDKLRLGGLIIADNVLWSGKVLNHPKDDITQLIDAFNQKIKVDTRVIPLLLPIRDGLMVIQKLT